MMNVGQCGSKPEQVGHSLYTEHAVEKADLAIRDHTQLLTEHQHMVGTTIDAPLLANMCPCVSLSILLSFHDITNLTPSLSTNWK